jgi:predicted O-methyltransferase YrrM
MEHFYQDIQGWFSFINVYQEMIGLMKDGHHYVEVGAWKGKSTSFMAVEIANSGLNIKFDVVDTWEGSNEIAHHTDPYLQNNTLYEHFIDNMKPVDRYYTPLRMTSVEASTLYTDNSLDFVLIDANHEYEPVKADILAWLPKVKSGSILAGDDALGAGVNQAVNETLPGVQFKGDAWWYVKP